MRVLNLASQFCHALAERCTGAGDDDLERFEHYWNGRAA